MLGKRAKNQVQRVRFLTQRLMMHQFGNYVLQKAISVVVDPKLKTQILEAIQLQASSLATTKHGPKVLQKLHKTYPHIFTSATPAASTYEAASACEQPPAATPQWQHGGAPKHSWGAHQ